VAIKINNFWRRHNNELMQLYGDLDIISFIRINKLRWIGHVNRMDNKRFVYQVFADQSQGSRPRGRPKSRCWDCDINLRSETGNTGRKIEKDWMRSIKEVKAHIQL
jgi:hypothetical protein